MAPGTAIVEYELSNTHWEEASASNSNLTTGTTGVPTATDELQEVEIDKDRDEEK